MAHGEKAGKVAFVSSSSGFHIHKPSYHIFFLQSHVNDVSLGALVLDAQPFVLGCLFVVDSNVLHDVGGQVLQHQLAVMAKELLSIQ